MSLTARPGTDAAEPGRVTIKYTENEDGWVTAQVVEYPAAISQGRTRDEAWLNVLDALHDVTHEPTLAERVAFAVEARLAEVSDLLAELGEWGERLIGAAAERGRAAVERGRHSGVH